MGNKASSVEINWIHLKRIAKHMHRSSKKCETNEKAALKKLRKAIEVGKNPDGARVYAQDAIREKDQALDYLRMACRLDACCSKIETAVRRNQVTDWMVEVVKGMDRSLLARTDSDKMSVLMDNFNTLFEDLDVKTGYMEQSMNATTVTSTPVDQVDSLINQVADAHNLQLGDQFREAGPIKSTNTEVVVPTAAKLTGVTV